MASSKIHKCVFKYCKYQSKDILLDDFIKINDRYFHKECAEIYNNIEEIKKIYYEKISNTVVMSLLVNVINNIIFVKNIDSNYLLFAIKYAVNKNIKINYPQGLYYIIDNYKIKDAWKKKQISKIKNTKFEIKEVKQPKFKMKASHSKSISNLFN